MWPTLRHMPIHYVAYTLVEAYTLCGLHSGRGLYTLWSTLGHMPIHYVAYAVCGPYSRFQLWYLSLYCRYCSIRLYYSQLFDVLCSTLADDVG